jgi:hypothetical protein
VSGPSGHDGRSRLTSITVGEWFDDAVQLDRLLKLPLDKRRKHLACIGIFEARRDRDRQQVRPLSLPQVKAFASSVSAIAKPCPLMPCHRPISRTPDGVAPPVSRNRATALL